MPSETNPYQSPAPTDLPPVRQPTDTRWRLAPTLLFAVLGAVLLLLGLGMLMMIAYQLITLSPEFLYSLWTEPVLRAVTMTITGASWLVAAWLFWTQRFRRASAAALFGFVVLVMAISMS